MSSTKRSYEQYRAALVARHQTALADRISVVGDTMLVISVGLIVARRFRAAGLTYAAAFAVEVAAHLFQPALSSRRSRRLRITQFGRRARRLTGSFAPSAMASL